MTVEISFGGGALYVGRRMRPAALYMHDAWYAMLVVCGTTTSIYFARHYHAYDTMWY